jgi:hypothetical protein
MLMNTNLLFVDNTFDIGASGVTRPRNLYLAGAASVDLGAVINETGGDYDFRVESDTNTHMLFVDAGTNTVGIGTSITDVSSFGLIVGSNTTANEGSISIVRGTYKSSPTDIGAMYWFNGGDATERAKPVAGIWGRDEYSGTTYNGSLHLGTETANIIYKRLSIEVSETVVNQDSLDVDFRVESDTDTHALFVDAGSNSVAIGTSTNFGGSSKFGVQADGTNGGVAFARNTDNVFACATDYYKSRGSPSSPTAVQNSDGIYQLRSVPYQGSSYTYLTNMAIEVDGTYTSGQNPPTRILFYTNTANGSPTERLAIKSSELVINDSSADYDFRVESDSNTHMLFVDAGNNFVNVALTSGVADAGALQIGAGGGTSSSIGINNSDNATISAKYGLVFQADNQDNIGSRFHEFRIGGKGYSDGRVLASFREGECVFNENSRDQDFRVESDANTNALFVDASLGTVNINGTGPGGNADVAGFQNLSSNGVLSTSSTVNVSSFARTQNVAAVNNSTVDAFRFLDHGGAVFATSGLAGHFYVNVTGGSGVNQFAAVYAVLTTGNGFGFGDSSVTLVSSVVRGTNPVSSVAIASDGAGGAVKFTITYINNSGVVTGGNSSVTFLGQVSNT